MVDRHEIKCINKTNLTDAHERISGIGGGHSDGTRWWISVNDAVAGVINNTLSFYVKQGNSTVDVIVAESSRGHKYLKTKSDGFQPNNLLSLPECPRM